MYDKFFNDIFGHDGTKNYMNQNLGMKGKSISNASQLSAITYVYTPTLRAQILSSRMLQIVEQLNNLTSSTLFHVTQF